MQSVKLWDLRTYQQTKTFACAQKIMCLAAFGEQGVAVGCIDRTVRVCVVACHQLLTACVY